MNKVTYTNNVTVIGADNLNEIQDEIIRLDAEKADLDSPALTGTPTAPTPTEGDSSTKIATTEFVKDAVGEAAQVDGNYPDMTVGGVISSTYTENSEPYTYRQSPSADIEIDEIVGGSVGWNQLVTGSTETRNGVTFTVNNGKWTITGQRDNTNTFKNITTASTTVQVFQENHVYFITGCNTQVPIRLMGNGNPTSLANDITATTVKKITTVNGATGTWARYQVVTDGTLNETLVPQITDLTLAFGSTIADYVYSLETATAGAGVTWLKTHFPKMFSQYNAYDAGSIKSVEGVSAHKMVGKNLLPITGTSRTVNGITFTINADGSVTANGTATAQADLLYCDTAQGYSDLNFSGMVLNGCPTGGSVTTYRMLLSDVYVGSVIDVGNGTVINRQNTGRWILYITIMPNYTANNLVFKPMIRLASETDATYEPYRTWSYPLDSSLTLRGIPKLDSSNNLYYDGDTYASDGTVTRKYGIVDLGTLNWSRSSTNQSNVYGFVTSNTIAKAVANADTLANLVCSKYQVITRNNVYRVEKNGISVGVDGKLYVGDSTYATETAASFKTAMSGVYLVYEKATPTTETANSFLNPQTVGSTEEYVTDSIVSVGHNTKYYDSFTVPKAPSTDGTYTLKVTVSGGFPTYTWEETE